MVFLLTILAFSIDCHAGISVVDEEGKLIRLKKAPMTESLKQVNALLAKGKVTPSDAFSLITLNLAKNLGLKKKGKIDVNMDADFTLFNSNYEVTDVKARGEILMQDGKIVEKGSYEL